jgi:hypothetical protein
MIPQGARMIPQVAGMIPQSAGMIPPGAGMSYFFPGNPNSAEFTTF